MLKKISCFLAVAFAALFLSACGYKLSAPVDGAAEKNREEESTIARTFVGSYTKEVGIMAEKAEKSSKKSWFDGLKAEFKKIIWPDRKSLVKQTGAVVAVSIVLGVMIAVLDFIFQYGIDILVNISF